MKKVSLMLALFLSGLLLKTQTVHMISALGADSTIYSNLMFDTSYRINHVEWLKPLKRESIEDYVTRLICENKISENDIIIGTSFGGIVATEIGKKIQPQKVILISSISFGPEKPAKFKFLKVLRFNKLIPKCMLNNPKLIIRSCFGKVSENEEKFLSQMIKNNDVDLISWSLNQIMKYNNSIVVSNLIKINGSNDKTFPSKNIDYDFIIDGTHLMVFNKANEISDILNMLLKPNFKIQDEIIVSNSTGSAQY